MTEYLRETRTTIEGNSVEVWHCPPPDLGVRYVVKRCTWNVETLERHIYEIEVVPC